LQKLGVLKQLPPPALLSSTIASFIPVEEQLFGSPLQNAKTSSKPHIAICIVCRE
jgi:hypothetical protein